MPNQPDEHGLQFGEEDPDLAQERLAAIIRSADDAIFSKDLNAVVTSWNPAAERLYGYSPEEMIGRSISIIVPSRLVGEERDILARVLRDEDVRHYETQRVTKDGRLIEVSVSASPLHDRRGNVVGASVIARDITEAKLLRAIADRLAAIVQSSNDAIYSKDTQAIVDSWNPAAETLYGYTADEAIGRHMRFVVPLDRKGEETEILHRILAGDRIEHFETERVTKSGEVIPVSITVSPVRDSDGHIAGASVIGRDVRERLRLAEVRRNLDRAEFIARAAHEIRSPVTTMTGWASLLADPERKLEAALVEEAVQAIARQGRVLEVLVKDLLDLSYIESGRHELKQEPVAVHDFVSDALETAPPPNGHEVVVEIATDCVAIGDSAKLSQVMVNLLNNAYKHGGNRVVVSCRATGDRVSVEVSDDGEGVPPEIRESLFQPFTRGDTRVAGAGLGLSMAVRLVEAQGGSIAVDSDSRGARFVMELCRSPAPAPEV